MKSIKKRSGVIGTLTISAPEEQPDGTWRVFVEFEGGHSGGKSLGKTFPTKEAAEAGGDEVVKEARVAFAAAGIRVAHVVVAEKKT